MDGWGRRIWMGRCVGFGGRTCTMMARRERSECTSSVERSMPSITSAPAGEVPPLVGSTSRQSAETNVDLPEPVRPTMPT